MAKRRQFTISFLFLVFLAVFASVALSIDAQAAGPTEYISNSFAPDEIVVKFKSSDKIIKKPNVQSLKPLFKNFKDNIQRLDTLRIKGALKTKYNLASIKISKKEGHILKRLI
ncbi:MAG: hypothetical protein UX61_C0029G0004 [Parcubacteria group bacterium GW2011_GWA2_46_7]|nr:MAG: hypothetical protein UX61_C0029G0004 [Parcubacteria group bacterium GW2011_GWA2_46_7]